METNLDRVETQPAPFGDLIELIVADGRRSVERLEKREERRQGCLEGFQLCEEMKGLGVLEFELALRQMEATDNDNRKRLHRNEIEAEDFRRHRCATAQIEYCYEILRVAYRAEHGHLPDDQRGDYSARAAITFGTLSARLAMNRTIFPPDGLND